MQNVRFDLSTSSVLYGSAGRDVGTLPLHHHTPPHDATVSAASVALPAPVNNGYSRRVPRFTHPDPLSAPFPGRPISLNQITNDSCDRLVGRLVPSENEDSSVSKYIANSQIFTGASIHAPCRGSTGTSEILSKESDADIQMAKSGLASKNAQQLFQSTSEQNSQETVISSNSNHSLTRCLPAYQHISDPLPSKRKLDLDNSSPDSEKQDQLIKSESKSEGVTSVDVKPTLSYIGLIAKAIMESPQNRLSLGSIYSWIEGHYPYYSNRGQGWRNSVRHNLSLNDCFIKAGRCEDGKGNYWAIHPANLQDFLRGDFRQRRRSRRRGRRKETEFGVFHVAPNAYLGGVAPSVPPGVPFHTPPPLNSLYSPYTEAERRAYRLDEALLRQSMNNPFVKWYNGTNSPYPAGTTPNSSLYPPSFTQWQTYPDGSSSTMYHHFSGLSASR